MRHFLWSAACRKKNNNLNVTTHHLIGADDLLQDLRQRALGLQVRVLVTEVEHQQGAVVRSCQPRGKSQDALLQVGHRWKAAQLFKGHDGILQRGDTLQTRSHGGQLVYTTIQSRTENTSPQREMFHPDDMKRSLSSDNVQLNLQRSAHSHRKWLEAVSACENFHFGTC